MTLFGIHSKPKLKHPFGECDTGDHAISHLSSTCHVQQVKHHVWQVTWLQECPVAALWCTNRTTHAPGHPQEFHLLHQTRGHWWYCCRCKPRTPETWRSFSGGIVGIKIFELNSRRQEMALHVVKTYRIAASLREHAANKIQQNTISNKIEYKTIEHKQLQDTA